MSAPETVFSSAERKSIEAEFSNLGSSAYLNYASTGPLPNRAKAAIDRINNTLQSLDRNFDSETDEAVARARRAAARLVGGKECDIGLMPNTSAGLNWALSMFNLQSHDALLITDPEFPAIRYAASYREQRGYELVRVPLRTGHGLEPADLEKALRAQPHVRVVALSWISFHNGFRHDLRGLASVCHAHNAFLLVDGIQGVGTCPLDVAGDGVDVLCSAVHKWLLAPVGLGFTWCSPGVSATFDSPWAGWMSVDWNAQYGNLFGSIKPFPRGPRAAETGTANYAGVRAMAETAEWIAEIGTDRICDYTQSLLQRLINQIDLERFEVTSNRSPEHRSSIVCLRPRSGEAERLWNHLAEAHITTSLREGAVRVSPHFPTSCSDIDQLVQSLHEFG